MSKNIELKVSDWIYNVGLLGLYNILEYKDEFVEVKKDGISFELEALEGFEEYYFKYLIKKYYSTLSINKINSFENIISNWEDEDFKVFDEKSLETLNLQIESVKKYITSNSYKSAYQLIDSEFNPLIKEKQLKKIKLSKKDTIEGRLEDIKNQVSILNEIIEYFKRKDSIKYIGAKNVMYTLIRNAWDNVSILNRQNKNPDMYDEVANYFVKPAIEYLDGYEKSKNKDKYLCMSCGSRIPSLNNDICFIRELGFDTKKKNSHVYDFNNYVGICPMCKLVYTCIPAGFTYAYNRGLFVNYSNNFKSLIEINNNIKEDVFKETSKNTSIYYAIQKNMDEKSNEDMKYELSDVQIVRFFRNIDSDQVKYSFNILNRPIQRVINECSGSLKFIRGAYFEEGKKNVYVYNEVMNNLFNNQNDFLIIHKMLHYKISNPDKTRYSSEHIQNVIRINNSYLREVGYMNDKSNGKYLYFSRVSGENLRASYKKMDAVEKLNGIAYRMLNALKTSNKHAFMDTLIKASMYANEAIDDIFSNTMEDDLKFKNAGYSFITGMLGKQNNSKNDSEDNGGEI
ncbi:CRISPR-associated protein Cst1 [Peptoniphilus asaccharolyticus DSM 20463]|uniref:CRISPR-associated protein Cst1 n=1 Tax=Peptoniphilus asaccharolyticus DSM 20463 TaxID=573058 RepID=A0A1W1VM31_PEPAS|nr:type I-B CRISPR-associated protein Cas8b1/Cst1 [Peptoniphilus asaccharolyticus]MBL7574521.1 type I-B CRISPR-associated protein Cas8b1/Cst1 [Peptoniphilus asaccharolyticus]SMB94280.1 CRISPR-associated protein Cst1 [Peptoniphilus asaccharolyticus DSM 20463]